MTQGGVSWKGVLKAAISLGVTAYVLRKIFANESLDVLLGHLASLSWPLLAAAFLAQVTAMACGIVRWRFLLRGQGIQIPVPHLIGTFLIGRFIGSFTPSTTGLDGWRMYEVARHSGATARSVSTIVVEKVIGFFVLAVLILATLPWGVRYLGRSAIGLVGLGVFPLAGLALFVLMKPSFVRVLFSRLPEKIRKKAASTLDAVTAYGERRRELLLAVAFGFPVHGMTIVLYVLTARALGVQTPVLDLAFVSLMVIAATLLPISIAGVGVREGAFVGLLGLVGVSASAAALTGFLGYMCGEILSLLGGLVLLARPADYRMAVHGEGVRSLDREAGADAGAAPLPMPWKGALQQGLSAGLLAGVFLGLGEAALVLAQSARPRDLSVLFYAAVSYGVATAGAGVALALVLAAIRARGGRAADAARLWATTGAGLFAGLGFVVARFRVFRDVFHENLRMMSGKGLVVQLGLLAAAAVVFWIGRKIALRLVQPPRAERVLVRTWGSPVAAVLVAGAVGLVSFLGSPRGPDGARAAGAQGNAAAGGLPNVLVVVVDTLRADAITAYGAPAGQTPHLDRLAREGVLFEKAFAQASWTRPSFASLLTGRFPSSHRTLYKADALPDEVVSLPEALGPAGYVTAGLVTNYNVSPYFNFDQGFDEYTYLEPELILWANDTASRLALYSTVRLVWERYVPIGADGPSRYYRDAEEVTDRTLGWLRQRPAAPFFLFVGYMDPHDPYFKHPYDGTSVARVSMPNPSPSRAAEMRALYDGEVHYWDAHFGRLLDYLRKTPGKSGGTLLDETLVVVTSDHGEEFGEHGGFWHGTTLYDEQIHVPLVAHLPRAWAGGVSGTRVRDWVRHVDVAPTILQFAQVPIPEAVQGRFLFADDAGGAGEPRRDAIYAEEDHEGNVLSAIRVFEDGRERKLILANPGNPRGLEPVELYDVGRDPGERTDLAPREQAEATAIRRQLQTAAAAAAEGAARANRIGLDESSAERLKSLGYAGGGE